MMFENELDNLDSLSPDELNELIGQFFSGEIEDAAPEERDPEQIRAAILERIDEIIAIIKPLDVEWQRLMQAYHGTLGWGFMVAHGANDRDGCERWRYARELWEQADDETLMQVEFGDEPD